ncbi:Methyltranfer_dom domain-containing protein [Psidium guajava]|nr:Methyltranfer_dom domain-containing protein [Psidium guajava]
MAGTRKYSCKTASQTLEWIDAIIHFIKPYAFLMNAHVVNFFTDRLWEAVDKEWMDCLRDEPVENLLLIPCGEAQDHWPASLKNFLHNLRSLVFPREQVDSQKIFPGLTVASLGSVLSQGMNVKKKHEVEILSAITSFIAKRVGAQAIVDVGAGQGYLAQVLSFQYQHSVVAIDACSHHGSVTNARAERIKKHYAAQLRRSGSVNTSLLVPKTVTCRVLSTDMLKALSDTLVHEDGQTNLTGEDSEELCVKIDSSYDGRKEDSMVLAGLHACGDLSVTMLKTFVECVEVKAVVSIGCCYNLLSEEGVDNAGVQCGFPMSNGVKSEGLSLGKCARDLACQSAERWRSLERDDASHNFELHLFRAAFQMVLSKYYPETLKTSPSIGRQGKALRRQQRRRTLESSVNSSVQLQRDCEVGKSGPVLAKRAGQGGARCEDTLFSDKCLDFEKFNLSGLHRLGLEPLQDINFHSIWRETEPFAELIGPYWSLRAGLGAVLETLILLDRLLFLQEKGSSLEAFMLPAFDPSLSPRNLAIVAVKI